MSIFVCFKFWILNVLPNWLPIIRFRQFNKPYKLWNIYCWHSSLYQPSPSQTLLLSSRPPTSSTDRSATTSPFNLTAATRISTGTLIIRLHPCITLCGRDSTWTGMIHQCHLLSGFREDLVEPVSLAASIKSGLYLLTALPRRDSRW